jgi:heat shock protein HslJ
MRTILLSLIAFSFFVTAACTSIKIPLVQNLENRKWVLDSLNGSKVSITSGKEITLQFDSENGKINGYGGCNNYFGNYIKDSGKLNISGLGSTKMSCTDLSMEQSYFEMLPKIDSYEIDNGILYLFRLGSIVMVFHSEN